MINRVLITIFLIISFIFLFVGATSLDTNAQLNSTAQTTLHVSNQTVQLNNQSLNEVDQDLDTNMTELFNVTNTIILTISEDDAEQAQEIISQVQKQLSNSTNK